MSRTKKDFRTESKENYLRFLKQYNVSESVLSYDKYKKNIEICNWMFIEYALRTGLKVYLPHGFGPIAVNKKKLKLYKEYKGKKYINLRVNWAKTKELKKKVYHTNEHSDGYNFKWVWFGNESKIHLSEYYVFKPGRYMSRAIAKYVKHPSGVFKEMYLDWSNYK